MKIAFFITAFVLGARFAAAQGTFVYDQQSTGTTDSSVALTQTPFGQSFTPTLDSLNFVDLQLIDFGSSASTVAVNVRSDSITGSLLGTSTPIMLPASSSSTYDFLFSDPISLTPGTQYYFEPVIVSGGSSVLANITFIQYTGGDLIQSGAARTDRDLWFREGVVTSVPEPSTSALFVIGGGVLFGYCRKRRTG